MASISTGNLIMFLSLACLWVGMLRMFEYVFCHFSKSRVGVISILSPIAVWENLFGNWD